MLRAAVTDVGRWRSSRRPIGASTITQQVAKNMLLSNELSISRKIKEVLLATRIDDALPKDRILELYLNEIYLGAGAYGVASAALTYFDKPLDELTLAEAAFLAGLPKAPSNYNPVRFPQAARNRRDIVLDQMHEAGFATPAEIAAAKADPVTVRHREDAEIVDAPYFAEEVRRELIARFGEKMVYEGGLTVRTSLDGQLQQDADKALRDGLITYDRAQWRLARRRVDHIDHVAENGDWAAALAAMPLPAGADAMNWQLALVLRTEGDGAEIGLKDGATGRIPFAQMRWARPLREDGSLGAFPRSAADVVKPGDVVLVDPLPDAPEPQEAGVSPQTRPAAGKARAALQSLPDPRGVRRARLDRPAYRARAGDERRVQLRDQPVQPRDPGETAARLGDQAVCLPDRAGDTALRPSTLVLDGPVSLDQGPGMPPWTARQLRSRRISRADTALPSRWPTRSTP